jgi:HEAT repeat protein
MEDELLEVLTAPDPREEALRFARRNRTQTRVLKRLLVAYREALSGSCLESLWIIFDRTIRRKCLRGLKSRWLFVRLQNVRLFVGFSKPEEAPALVALLHDKPEVRLAVLGALTGIPDDAMLAHIIGSFEADPKPNLYAYSNIFFSLGQRISPFLRESLLKPLSVEKTGLLIEIAGRLFLRSLYRDISAFADHPDKELRIRTARALGMLSVPAARETMIRLAADAAWEVRAQTLRGLGYLKDRKALPILAEGMFSPNWHVRYNAGHGLAAFGLAGILRLQEIARQKADRYAADMAAMVLDTVVLTEGG